MGPDAQRSETVLTCNPQCHLLPTADGSSGDMLSHPALGLRARNAFRRCNKKQRSA